MKIPDMDELVGTEEAAAIARVTPSTIRSWKHRKQLKPSGLDDRNRPLYKVGDVIRTEAATRRRHTGQRTNAKA